MTVAFNSLLEQVGLAPAHVILLRHQDRRAGTRKTPYELWRDERTAFELYQSCQSVQNRSKFARSRNWASFVATPDGTTMFVGLYSTSYQGLLAQDTPQPHADKIDRAGSCDFYKQQLDVRLDDLAGRLFIDWGKGTRAWVQRADKQAKHVTELRLKFMEDEFPGYLNFAEPLSRVEGLPTNWIATLKHATGVYLLTCPRTKEHYVGSACGNEGFWYRWMEYAVTGHGGNVVLKSREPSDYQVSILEVAGSASSSEDILKMETRWKMKLQSREMGLNAN